MLNSSILLVDDVLLLFVPVMPLPNPLNLILNVELYPGSFLIAERLRAVITYDEFYTLLTVVRFPTLTTLPPPPRLPLPGLPALFHLFPADTRC